jgi:hypothetical protein
MPAKSVEQLKQRTAALRKKLAEKGSKMEGAAVRKLKKSIRRTQRRRRKFVATEARRAKSAEKAETPQS